ncbi:DMT family transporter [Variovorax sp. Varisp62]|uniref:DMT family transporter n=1 Tax=Variovorax sp. Varisp62 TaxID=3243049 RepID=UPI0039B6BCB4
MSQRQRLSGIAALLLATSGWGSLFLVSKGVLHHVEPVWFTLIRYTLSMLLFVLLILPRGAAPWRKLRLHAGPLALRGAAGFGVFSVMLLVGLAHSVPSHGAVIIATTPMTTQLVRWVLDGVRPTRTTLLTSALALLGVATVSGLLLGGAGSSAASSTLLGDAIAFGGTLGWVWYTRGTTRFPELDVIEYTALTVLASWPVLLAAAVGASLLGWSAVPSLEGLRMSWHALLFVGVVPSAISVLAFNYGVRALGAVTGTAFLNFVPVSALLMSAALGKLPTVNEAVGMAMVVVALLLHTASNRKASTATTAQATPAPQTYRTCGATAP